MLHVLALLAAAAAGPSAQPATASPSQPIVSTEWLQAHLTDPHVRVLYVGDRDDYNHAHIPGARLVDHMDTIGDNHRLLPPNTLARALAKAGARQTTRAWCCMATADGNGLGVHGPWHRSDTATMCRCSMAGSCCGSREKRPTSTATPATGAGPLTPRPAPDVIVDAAWVRSRLESPSVRVLDGAHDRRMERRAPARRDIDFVAGSVRGSADAEVQVARRDSRRAHARRRHAEQGSRHLLRGRDAGEPDCTGPRAPTGVNARVYVGSWQDWQRNSENPIVR